MERSNLSTRTKGFWVLTHGAGGPREWLPVEMVGQGVRIPPWKFQPISSTLPPEKAKFSSVWHGSLSRWLPFEHSGTKMGILDIEPVHSTLCPSITATRSTSKFHLNMFQNSVRGDVMTDTITYGQDCIRNEYVPSINRHLSFILSPMALFICVCVCIDLSAVDFAFATDFQFYHFLRVVSTKCVVSANQVVMRKTDRRTDTEDFRILPFFRRSAKALVKLYNDCINQNDWIFYV